MKLSEGHELLTDTERSQNDKLSLKPGRGVGVTKTRLANPLYRERRGGTTNVEKKNNSVKCTKVGNQNA